MVLDNMSAADSREVEMPAEALGRRLSCEGERGTVRYVGEVPPTAGIHRVGVIRSTELMTCRPPTSSH